MTDNQSNSDDESAINNPVIERQKAGDETSEQQHAPPVSFDDCVTARAQVMMVQNDVQEFMETQRDKLGSALQRWESISLEDLDEPLREQVETTRSELRTAYKQLGGQQ